MTLDEFRSVAAERIPTPGEFVAFAEGQGWRFGDSGGRPALFAPKTDPMAVAFARMLSREPYRTNVLELLKARGATEDHPEPPPRPETKPVPLPQREECRVCGRDVSDPEDRERLADPAFCDRGGARAYQDCDGVLHPESERCPFKPR